MFFLQLHLLYCSLEHSLFTMPIERGPHAGSLSRPLQTPTLNNKEQAQTPKSRTETLGLGWELLPVLTPPCSQPCRGALQVHSTEPTAQSPQHCVTFPSRTATHSLPLPMAPLSVPPALSSFLLPVTRSSGPPSSPQVAHKGSWDHQASGIPCNRCQLQLPKPWGTGTESLWSRIMDGKGRASGRGKEGKTQGVPSESIGGSRPGAAVPTRAGLCQHPKGQLWGGSPQLGVKAADSGAGCMQHTKLNPNLLLHRPFAATPGTSCFASQVSVVSRGAEAESSWALQTHSWHLWGMPRCAKGCMANCPTSSFTKLGWRTLGPAPQATSSPVASIPRYRTGPAVPAPGS